MTTEELRSRFGLPSNVSTKSINFVSNPLDINGALKSSLTATYSKGWDINYGKANYLEKSDEVSHILVPTHLATPSSPLARQYNSALKERSIVFCMKSSEGKGIGLKLNIVATLCDVNRTLREGHQRALKLIQAASQPPNALPKTGVLSTHANEIASILNVPEATWDKLEFFAQIGNSHEMALLNSSMTLKGIYTRWGRPFVQISDGQVGEYETGESTVIGVGIRGYCQMFDYFGPAARSLSKLYLILKRGKGCKDNINIPFAYHPYVSHNGIVPTSETTYYDYAGNIRRGLVIPFARVVSATSNTQDENLKNYISGLTLHTELPSNAHTYAGKGAGTLVIHLFGNRLASQKIFA